MKTKFFVFLIITTITFLTDSVLFSDVVTMKDGNEIKGIVVEDYNDRIVLSTYKGEEAFSKEKIHKIYYDLPEQNLVKLGDAYMAKKDYSKAYFYYDKAYKANPDYKLAREKLNYVMGYIFRKSEEAKKDDVARMQEVENWPFGVPNPEEDFEEMLIEDLGIRLAELENRIIVSEVLEDSPASIAGIREGDALASVWGKLTGYMPTVEVARLLLEESSGEIKLGITRDVTLDKAKSLMRNYKEILGLTLDMLPEGLTIINVKEDTPAEKAELKEGDLVIAIDYAQTRYMPIKDAINLIENSKRDTIIFTIKRKVTAWRK